MRDPASAHDGASHGRGDAAPVAPVVCERQQPMTRNDAPRHDPEESPRVEDTCAGFGTENGYLLYDTGNATAWIESDTTVDPAELR